MKVHLPLYMPHGMLLIAVIVQIQNKLGTSNVESCNFILHHTLCRNEWPDAAHPDSNMRLPLPKQRLGVRSICLQHIVAVHDGFSRLLQLEAARRPVQQAWHSHSLQLVSHLGTAAGQILGHFLLVWGSHLRKVGQSLGVLPDCGLVITLQAIHNM